uniref:Transmembrane protein n=1 Tax=Rhizochromulina marina TaxID=1034831 RepID=A0A7S2S5B2_9STRA|mmetsp:Transcript_25343/g.73969  ORF Transcript_25343/g.73969 Transcript_25343/m.73969 type:complete len:156 (+) Transcript_25343:347-814(+)|eukprot:CAMPEP_0118961768 /NCGR_PEP_ID=MMETSP1173-20130426/347_1 /TAXON_ID=1034831 /ORGANISM="Rhizochromulina marina cf, Strain CCMP1243" /LENGTH=155 /DNA_ID=CAMNT_0006909955 /DNA_START=260 /DNA_END=727 /DNA_ORIENTATION=-
MTSAAAAIQYRPASLLDEGEDTAAGAHSGSAAHTAGSGGHHSGYAAVQTWDDTSGSNGMEGERKPMAQLKQEWMLQIQRQERAKRRDFMCRFVITTVAAIAVALLLFGFGELVRHARIRAHPSSPDPAPGSDVDVDAGDEGTSSANFTGRMALFH